MFYVYRYYLSEVELLLPAFMFFVCAKDKANRSGDSLLFVPACFSCCKVNYKLNIDSVRANSPLDLPMFHLFAHFPIAAIIPHFLPPPERHEIDWSRMIY